MDNRTRTVLSLVTEEDLGILAKAGKVEPIKDKRMVRLINEAKQQGAVLSQADLTAIMLLSSATLSKRTRKYQKEAGKLLPTAGNGLDIGHYPESMHLNRMEGNIVSNGN